MPRRYRRSTFGRRRSSKARAYRKRVFSRRRGRVNSARSKAVAQRRYATRIERALKVEYKVGDVAYTAQSWSSDTGGAMYPLIKDMAIAQSIAARDRAIGNQICIKGLYLGLTFGSGSTAVVAVPVTIALVRSRNNLTAANVAPTEEDVFDIGNITTVPPSLMVRRTAAGAGYGVAVAGSGAGPYGNHKVVWLRRFVVPVTANLTSINAKTMTLKKVFKMNVRCVFGSSDLPTYNTPEYTLIGWSDAPAATTTQRPSVYVYCRMIYTDI